MSIKQLVRALTGRRAAREDAGASRFGASTYRSVSLPPSQSLASIERQLRRDLLRVVLRDVQVDAGLAPTWLELEILISASSNKPNGMHARIVMRTWVPKIMQHAATIERMFMQRLLSLDPQAHDWFRGLSWKLNLPEGQAEAPLPAPAEWFRTTRPAAWVTPPRASESAGVIAGPVHVGTPAPADRADRLEALSRQLDASGHANQRGVPLFAPTQASPLPG